MSLRDATKADDLRSVILALLKSKTGSPWARWDFWRGFSMQAVAKTEKFTKPVIYLLLPKIQSDGTGHVGGGKILYNYEMTIGFFCHELHGGEYELSLIGSHLASLFTDPATHKLTFNVTLDIAYSNTTLTAQKIKLRGVRGPRDFVADVNNWQEIGSSLLLNLEC